MTHEEPPHRLGVGVSISLFAFLFFATASSLVWTFKDRFPTIQIIFIQNFVSLLCTLPFSIRRGFHHLRSDNIPVHLIRDLFGVGSYFLCFLAIRQLNLVDAMMLNYTAPIFVPIIARIWQKEKITLHVWWAILIGFVGISVILNPTKAIFTPGFLTGLSAGIASAVAFTAIRVLNIKKEPLSRTLFYYFTIGTVGSLPFAEYYWVAPTLREWGFVTLIGVATAIGQMLLTLSYRFGTASYLSPLGYSTIVYAALISYLLFDTPITLQTLLGAVLIIFGGTLTYLFSRKPKTLRETFEQPPPKT